MSAHEPRERQAVAAASRPREVLTLRLGDEEYGIDILNVQEIRSFERPTRIAGAPAAVLGAANLRGVIVPVVDLRQSFGLPPAACGATTATIVLHVDGRVVGLVVDQVCDVVAIAPQQILPPPLLGGAVRQVVDAIAMLRVDAVERMVLLLDIEQLVRSGELGLSAAAGGADLLQP